jgi:hypothetical protein
MNPRSSRKVERGYTKHELRTSRFHVFNHQIAFHDKHQLTYTIAQQYT